MQRIESGKQLNVSSSFSVTYHRSGFLLQNVVTKFRDGNLERDNNYRWEEEEEEGGV